jgi:hypothetical protein
MNQKQFEFEPPVRLNRQQDAIIERLRKGPATNAELVQIIWFTARIHELRKAGYEIEIVKKDHESGLVWYALKE